MCKPISKKAHDELLAFGWIVRNDQTYTHSGVPGHTITLLSHKDAGGGRMAARAVSKSASGVISEIQGAEFIGYHGMRLAMPWNTKMDAAVKLAKAEVLRDIYAGIVPSTLKSFAELHDFVDANGYGGAFDESPSESETDSFCVFWNRVQDAVDVWLKAGRPQ